MIFTEWYLPGYKAGGLVTSVANLIEFCGDSFDLFVITRDRDLTDNQPYSGLQCNEWVPTGKARVLYTADFSFRHLRRRILEVAPNVVYLNSFFSVLTVKALCLRRSGLLPAYATVLAPRGEFSPGALKLKRWRKWIYQNLALRGGLCSDLVWHASSDLECEHIDTIAHKMGLKHAYIHLGWELPSPGWLQTATSPAKLVKRPGVARFLFFSRISPKKNLLFMLQALGKLNGRVECDVYGPVDDRDYWEDCKKQIGVLPRNVALSYRGAIARESVPRVAEEYHFFLLPTLGENFGYAILEAMAAGCPVVLSDHTPWHDVQPQGAGWCLPLADPELWRHTLQRCVDMDEESFQLISLRARQFVKRWSTSSSRGEETVQLFWVALERSKSPTLASSIRQIGEFANRARGNARRGAGATILDKEPEILEARQSNIFGKGKQ